MKVEIYKILRKTAGGFHSICESNVGIIRKENKNIENLKPKWYIRLWLFLLRFYNFIRTFIRIK